MSEELEVKLDKLSEILWCKKLVRDDGSIAYMMPNGESGHIVMTNRLKRLNTYIEQREQVALTSGFQESNASEVDDE